MLDYAKIAGPIKRQIINSGVVSRWCNQNAFEALDFYLCGA